LMEKYSLEDGDLWEVVTPTTYYYWPKRKKL
jgi:hypothetical protein